MDCTDRAPSRYGYFFFAMAELVGRLLPAALFLVIYSAVEFWQIWCVIQGHCCSGPWILNGDRVVANYLRKACNKNLDEKHLSF